jgi:cystathionine beta-lyase family protein involved in aluminum resistance
MQQQFFTLNPVLLRAEEEAKRLCRPVFEGVARTAEYNSMKVLHAFIDNRVSESHFAGSTGYGYGDRGRETLDAVFAEAFGAEDALVRHNFVSGTHAIATALFGLLRPGDLMLALTGKPYDTLDEVIGLRGSGMGSLRDFGVQYGEVALLPDGAPDLEGIRRAVAARRPRVAYIQRSRGYSLRPSLRVAAIGEIVRAVREACPSSLVVVDNCYGEFVEREEPVSPSCGADLMIGSLIKNPGAGMANTGGYIAGRKELIELVSYRLTTPGMGREVGATLGESRNMFKGIFFAPHVTGEALKTAIFTAAFFSSLGFKATPRFDTPRADIIETLELGSPEALIAFCQGMQKGAPIDSFVRPEPWDMPGYDSKVIMAAGTFTMGASIELSADAPLKPPYAAWMQGGLTYETGKTGVLLAAQSMLAQGFISR